MSEPGEDVLYAIGRGVAALRAELAETTSRAEMAEGGVDQNYNRVKLAEKRLSEVTAERDEYRKLAFKAETALDDGRKRGLALRTDYDAMRQELYHLIVELSGHRDTAKTKAERVALGHVVERLKEIRPLSDTQKAEVGDE